ncbi:MAG: ABC transporter substrate-binding protein [Pseudomonadota bacterium]
MFKSISIRRMLVAGAALSAVVAAGALLMTAHGPALAPSDAMGANMTRPSPAEVMHFWNSGSERSALDVIRAVYVQRGGTWVDTSEADNPALRRAILERISTNTMPTAVLWQSNVEMRDLAELGVFGDIDSVARREHWDTLLPNAVRTRVQSDGHYYMAPTNVHNLTWVFYNEHVLQRLHMTQPHTWPEVIEVMHRAHAAGIRAVAIGDGDWEVQIMFTGIIAGSLGPHDYDALVSHHDFSVLSKPSALNAFNTLAEIRSMVRQGGRYKGWDDASHAIAHGDAAFQFMGDWAKAEMERAGGRVGEDIGCMLTPGVEHAVMLTIDGFAFPASDDPARIAARDMLADVILDRDVQARFAAEKGALPARLDSRPRQPDRCESILMERLADNSPALESISAGLPSGLSGDFQALVSRFFNDPHMTPEQARADAIALFRSALQDATP